MSQEPKTNPELTPEILKQIEEVLVANRQQIIEDLSGVATTDSHEADNMAAKFPEYGDKPDENAQEISDYSTNIATDLVMEKALKDIDSTLERIKKGSYGICKYCGKAINVKRLIARPTASSCVECKTELQENE